MEVKLFAQAAGVSFFIRLLRQADENNSVMDQEIQGMAAWCVEAVLLVLAKFSYSSKCWRVLGCFALLFGPMTYDLYMRSFYFVFVALDPGFASCMHDVREARHIVS